MLSSTHFYYRITRKCVVGFANLFKDLVLVKYSNDSANISNTTEISRITVPLVYGGKEAYTVRNDMAQPNLDLPGSGGGSTIPHPVEIKLPIMAFSLVDMTYNAQRKQQSLLQQYMQTGGSGANNMYQGVPYDLKFTLWIFVRNVEDGLQLVEQILPWFTPSYTLALNLVPNMNIVKDIPITIDGISWENDYEGDAPDKIRRIIWKLDFTMQSFFYGPVYSHGLITTATANINFLTSGSSGQGLANAATTLTLSANGFGTFTPGEIVFQGNNLPEATAFGTMKTFSNNSIFVMDTRGSFTSNTIVLGALSGAQWNVAAVPNTSRIVQIVVTPSPPNANQANGQAYTANTVITEAPKLVS